MNNVTIGVIRIAIDELFRQLRILNLLCKAKFIFEKDLMLSLVEVFTLTSVNWIENEFFR